MPEAAPSILSPKNDFVFKQIFGDSTHIAPLAAFLQAALGLPAEEFAGLMVIDPNLNREYEDDKHCILDVRIKTRSGRDVDVEIQVAPTLGLCDRIQYYTARMVTEKVNSGEDYRGMAQSICIVILDYRVWDIDERYHHRFRLYDPEAGMAYPNSMEIHTLELPKRPVASDGSGLWDWLTFLSSKTQDEFTSLARKGGAMAEAVAKLMELSADEKARLRAEARDKWQWDNASRMRQSREEGEAAGKAAGEANIVRRMLLAKMPLSEIANITGWSVAEIERLTSEKEA